MRIRVISFTKAGQELSLRIKELLGEKLSLSLYTKCSFMRYGAAPFIQVWEKDLQTYAGEAFANQEALVFIGACGIAIRSIAPFVTDKKSDPPVVVIDEKGNYVIPILSSHLGGAQKLGQLLAQVLEAELITTTASDVRRKFAIDLFAKENGLYLTDPGMAKTLEAEILNGQNCTMGWYPESFQVRGKIPEEIKLCRENREDARILITPYIRTNPHSLQLVPRNIFVGIGCKKGKSSQEILALLLYALEKNQLSPHAIHCIASIDLKKEEKGLIQVAETLNVPFHTYTGEELKNREPAQGEEFSGSEFVESVTGVSNVCERAAMCAGGTTLIQKKISYQGITVALAMGETVIDFGGEEEERKEDPVGQKIYVVGIGPGAYEDLTIRAAKILKQCDVIAGYNTYVNLIKNHFEEKEFLSTPMKQEVKRCRLAIACALQGKKVAMISSGDAGIYGMAGLMYETLDKILEERELEGVRLTPDMESRLQELQIEVVPGITAASSGAAVLGAPLVHDFAVISLSDLLTPWDTILSRLTHAAKADLGIVLYNPSSHKRADYLKKACCALEQIIPGDRICGIVENIGRAGENYQITTLCKLKETPVNMFTTIFIGNSQTREIQDHMITPRGYAEVKQKEKQCVLLFAGTSEGRELAGWLTHRRIPCIVSVATEYGTLQMQENPYVQVLEGRMSKEKMGESIALLNPRCVVDATHPYATQVTKQIKELCQEKKVPYLRLSRDTGSTQEGEQGILYCENMEQAARYLMKTEGPILLTTGSKELSGFMQVLRMPERVFARVLPSMESIRLCQEAGIEGKHILAMQGPFTVEMNREMIGYTKAAYLVTKKTGLAGGYEEKIQAAGLCNCTTIVIANPEEEAETESFFTEDSIRTELCRLFDIPTEQAESNEKRQITLIGIGMGGQDFMTLAAHRALEECQIVFGHGRLLAQVRNYEKMQEPRYKWKDVYEYLHHHPQYKKAVVVLSGDTGFYSGARSFQEHKGLGEDSMETWEIKVLPGISSVSYFASKLNTCWQDWSLFSAHGRSCDFLQAILHHKTCFFLMDGIESLEQMGRQLQNAVETGKLEPADWKIAIGYQLSYPEECIFQGGLEVLEQIPKTPRGLYVVLIEKAAGIRNPFIPGIPDHHFLRQEKIPMTKEEVRALCLCKLKPYKDAILYDIGAGTGSVTVECAKLCPLGTVYAFEQKPEAVEICKKNVEQLQLQNVRVLQKKAPEGMEDLPAPSHVFLGGTGGNLKQIYDALKAKNCKIKVVMTAITLETAAQITDLLREENLQAEIVGISLSKAKNVGEYHMMTGQNPILLVTFTIG